MMHVLDGSGAFYLTAISVVLAFALTFMWGRSTRGLASYTDMELLNEQRRRGELTDDDD